MFKGEYENLCASMLEVDTYTCDKVLVRSTGCAQNPAHGSWWQLVLRKVTLKSDLIDKRG